MAKKLKPFAKLLIVIAVMGGLFGIYQLVQKFAPGGGGAGRTKVKDVDLSKSKLKRPIRVCVVTWGGYAGGQYFNNGFKASKESRFYTDYGILVEFVVMDDFASSRAAWKAGKVDLMWITADSFPTESEALKQYNPKIIFQADWSRGGDAIVVSRGIAKVSDLRGKKIAVAAATPSHTFLLWLLKAGDMTLDDVKIIEAPSAIDAAAYFKAGKVEAAVVWSPDDADCVAKVKGAKVLKSSREASHIIADVFYVKQNFLDKYETELKNLIEGWFKGAAEVNGSESAKLKAAKILAEGLDMPEDFCYQAINNVRLTTYGDNVNFFNINGNYNGVTGESLYTTMKDEYAKIGLASSSTPEWRSIATAKLIRQISLSGAQHAAEGGVKFTAATETVKKSAAFSSKAVRISFASGSYALDENTKYIIDKEMVPLAKAFAQSRIRIEGNTDTVGSRELNISLSKKRARAVVNYLQSEYGFDRNRFIVVGNGPDNPIADNSTSRGRAKNRRTDFQMLNQ